MRASGRRSSAVALTVGPGHRRGDCASGRRRNFSAKFCRCADHATAHPLTRGLSAARSTDSAGIATTANDRQLSHLLAPSVPAPAGRLGRPLSPPPSPLAHVLSPLVAAQTVSPSLATRRLLGRPSSSDKQPALSVVAADAASHKCCATSPARLKIRLPPRGSEPGSVPSRMLIGQAGDARLSRLVWPAGEMRGLEGQDTRAKTRRNLVTGPNVRLDAAKYTLRKSRRPGRWAEVAGQSQRSVYQGDRCVFRLGLVP